MLITGPQEKKRLKKDLSQVLDEASNRTIADRLKLHEGKQIL